MKSTDKQRDEHLVLQCRAGHKSACALLVERWHQKLCKQAYFHTKDIDLSKDIAQDTWTVIFSKLDQLKAPEKFGSWALSIANRKAIDALRKQVTTAEKLRRFQEQNNVIEHEDTYNTGSATSPSEERVLRAVKSLPLNQQQVVRLFYVQQYNLAEISALLKVSKGTVKSRLFYAREKLKELIKNNSHES